MFTEQPLVAGLRVLRELREQLHFNRAQQRFGCPEPEADL
jgi:hypothetical protein